MLDILDHEVIETINVARRLENVVGHDGGILDLEQVFFNDEVLAPLSDDIGLESSSGGTVRVESSTSAVNVEGRAVEKATLANVVEFCARLYKGIGLDGLGCLSKLVLKLAEQLDGFDEFRIILRLSRTRKIRNHQHMLHL